MCVCLGVCFFSRGASLGAIALREMGLMVLARGASLITSCAAPGKGEGGVGSRERFTGLPLISALSNAHLGPASQPGALRIPNDYGNWPH